MLAFSRITSILLFVLSLSFLTCAAPAPKANDLAIREGVRGDDGLLVAGCIDLLTKTNTHADLISKTDDPVEAKAAVALVVNDLKVYADLVSKVKGLKANLDVQAEIAAHLLVIVKAVIKICASLIAKFGLNVALELIATVQVALKLVIDNLNICITGFLDVFVKIVAEADVKALADVHLNAILKVIVALRVKLGLGVNINVAGLVGVAL
ncbi:unnamed protein product [Rhizoctonia solani]|uniref:Transmembrane protein n=1 Tax=Rhizoctonia solani TaxID=456999 RepID=A0A8H3BPV2_9AGAM|nr:unnamed protein product [Rhizoctonia solani]CAE6463348.1 unnamed protein product [Rhizoctonia solani]